MLTTTSHNHVKALEMRVFSLMLILYSSAKKPEDLPKPSDISGGRG